ncbi:MAG: UDP-N-acetylmuramoyl-L-alanyl-D-glutamate--2,6-diaminopimelate ligase [Clostridia bacterium]|nr:UDP-N-acetylmuramoyl-L-alanyl-D-glutamate--2,6-diaminopimelate ligase [Clostridia bacterium]
MRLSKIIENIDLQGVYCYDNVEVGNITIDSRDVGVDSLYIALKGSQSDGHSYIGDAVNNGAAAIMCETHVQGLKVPQLIVSDTRKALSIACGNFFDNPADKMTTIAVVGTNGKTTTSYLIAGIANEGGVKCGLIGTMYYSDGEHTYPASLTTPDPWQLNKLMKEMYDKGCRAVVMEVSAHAIYLKKTANILFDIGVFTNISQDHLDFFKTMEEYAQVKESFFTSKQCRCAVINSDDELGIKLNNELNIDKVTYGLSNPADIFAIEYNSLYNDYIVNDIDDIFEVKSNLYGKFNVSNTLAAIAVADKMGISRKDIARALARLPAPEGRFNVYESGGVKYVIDFAHTPDGLRNLLIACAELGDNITVLFGCGGDRDKLKRPLMGAIAAELSDKVIITSDNPRSERREDIIAQILQGIAKDCEHKAVVIADRREAIDYACKTAVKGDIVILAGKGSENYIDEKGVKSHYSDYEQLLESLSKNEHIR